MREQSNNNASRIVVSLPYDRKNEPETKRPLTILQRKKFPRTLQKGFREQGFVELRKCNHHPGSLRDFTILIK